MLNNPELIGREIERRLQEHRQSSPAERRQAEVSKELARIEHQTDKLIDAYQEGLMGIDELRSRVPELKKRQVSLQKEFESLTLQTLEHGRLLEVNVSLEKFMEQLKNSAQNLDIQQKQKIVRLLVREVVLSPGTATIHHSIPLPQHRDG